MNKQERLEALRKTLPELPDAALERLQSEFGLSPRDSGILVALGEGTTEDAHVGVKFFEKVAKGRDAQIVANW